MTSVLLGDFEPMLRVGLKGLLTDAGCVVVGEETRGVDVIERARRLHPDVVVVDAAREGGSRTLDRLITAVPTVTVLVCSSQHTTMHAFPRFHHGESYVCTLNAQALAAAAHSR